MNATSPGSTRCRAGRGVLLDLEALVAEGDASGAGRLGGLRLRLRLCDSSVDLDLLLVARVCAGRSHRYEQSRQDTEGRCCALEGGAGHGGFPSWMGCCRDGAG